LVAAVLDATAGWARAGATIARQAGAVRAFLRDGLTGELTGELDGETIAFWSDEGDAERLVELAPTPAVRLVKAPPRRPDLVAGALADAVRERGIELVLGATGTTAAELATRLACRTGGAVLTDALDLEVAAGRLLGRATVYSGHLRGRFELSARPWCVTLDASWNDERTGGGAPDEHIVLSRSDVIAADDASAADDVASAASFDDLELLDAPPAGDLAGSRFLVVAGYGAGDRTRLERIAGAACRLGAAFGVSRPVVMNGWAPADRLIGVSGSRTTPEVCLVVGASGAPALQWGFERAGFVVAVNPDEHAPIVYNADVVVLDDGVAVIEALAELVNA
jgi:electron transfer flavoprotein alpha subunit